jgi:hypothetical protein
MKKYLILLIVPFMFACGGTNSEHIKEKGQAFDAGKSKAMNAFDFEYKGYKYILFSGINNGGGEGSQSFNGIVLDPAYDQNPKFKVRYEMIVDTLQELSGPIPIDIKW